MWWSLCQAALRICREPLIRPRSSRPDFSSTFFDATFSSLTDATAEDGEWVVQQDYWMNSRERFQGFFVIAGIALIIAGLNNSYPIAIAGGALIVLALVGRFLGKTKE